MLDITDFLVGIVDDMSNKQDKISIATGLKYIALII